MSASSKTEIVANAATVVVALLLSVVLVRVYLLPTRAPRSAPAAATVAVGTNLASELQGVDWKKNGRTLILAISTQCHFCTDSAPFFRTLVTRAGKGVKIVAVLPQPVAQAEQYLSGEGVHVDAVKQLALGRIGVRGTPTMLLVNGQGIVTHVWLGELSASQQEEALNALTRMKVARGPAPSGSGASRAEASRP